MENCEIQNRIGEELTNRGMRAVELSERAKVSEASLSHWIKQHWQPKQKALMSMARVLEVSELWLAGYDVPKERPVEQIKTDKLAQLVHRLREDNNLYNLCMDISELSEEQLTTIYGIVKQFKLVSED